MTRRLLGRLGRSEDAAGAERPTHSASGSRRLLRRLGRGLLWLTLALVFVRGIGAIMHGPASAAPVSHSHAAATDRAGDDEARAFAIGFARAYLTINPRRSAEHDRAVARYLSQGLSDQASVIASPRGPGASVAEATVAREVPLGGSRVLITVAAFLNDGRSVYLNVPVARDDRGGLAVFDLPSIAVPPPAGEAAAESDPPLSDTPTASGVSDLVGRFLRAYIGGQDEGTLAYFLAPGVALAPMPGGLALLDVGELDSGATPSGGAHGQTVIATVRVRDLASHIIYRLRYRVTVVLRDRWYVASVAGGPQP